MTRSGDVTVVIAARDEEATIGGVVGGCLHYAGTVLVTVDCRTTDDTVKRATRAGARILLDEGRGKGHAMRLAIPHIETKLTVFIDADGSHDHRDIPLLLRPLLDGTADHVSASRLRGGSSELHGGFDEFFRLTGSSFITACINHRFGVRLSDSQNGFRAIRTELLRALGLRSDSTTIEQEMIIRTLGMGYRMAEIPSHEYQRVAGTSHIRLRRVALGYVANLVRHLYLTRYPTPGPAAALPSLASREPARH
jgi:glycosyltransferase involved in cell wall biosynthesis